MNDKNTFEVSKRIPKGVFVSFIIKLLITILAWK